MTVIVHIIGGVAYEDNADVVIPLVRRGIVIIVIVVVVVVVVIRIVGELARGDNAAAQQGRQSQDQYNISKCHDVLSNHKMNQRDAYYSFAQYSVPTPVPRSASIKRLRTSSSWEMSAGSRAA